MDITSWMSHKHLNLKMFKTELFIAPSKPVSLPHPLSTWVALLVIWISHFWVMLILLSHLYIEGIFMSCWFYFLKSLGSISSFPLQQPPCSSSVWPSRRPPSWPLCCNLSSLSLLTECSFWNPIWWHVAEWEPWQVPAATGWSSYFLAWHAQPFMPQTLPPSPALPLTASHALTSEAISFILVPSPCHGPTPPFIPLSTWPIPFLPRDSALTSPSCSGTATSVFFSITSASAMARTNMSTLRLGSLVLHLFMLRPITLLIDRRHSINVSNELMKTTQRNIYLMEAFNIAVREIFIIGELSSPLKSVYPLA